MKYIIYGICLSMFIVGQASAIDTISLKNIGETEFKKLRLEVKKHVVNDINISFPAHFDESQSFMVVSENVTLFKLIPVTFNSKKAKNDICVLAVFSGDNKLLENLPLHYETGDGDEIVASCIGVQAVASERRDNTNHLIYLLRYRAGNNYGDTVYIASINADKITKNETLSDCVSNKNGIDSIIKVRKAIKQCLDHHKD